MPDARAFEADFFGVLEDLSCHLGDLTLVGGWVPYVYARFLWRASAAKPVFTADVDWGLAPAGVRPGKKTVFETVFALDYAERHLELGKLQPVVVYRKNRTRLDFIVPAGTAASASGGILGRELAVSRLENFDFLLKNTLEIALKRGGEGYVLRCPRPAAFALHKCATFTDRDDRHKMGKDLYYAYFVLRHAPDPGGITAEVKGYSGGDVYARAAANIKKYFSHATGQGCVMVEKENGPDEYIEDLPGDIYRRLTGLFQ